ncbi:MAG TPA: DUF1232 domain-containing protein [Acidimicrobiales bacterium]|nr:DUF1232 domain-containing protein [Acidimicrobiales bacterium]
MWLIATALGIGVLVTVTLGCAVASRLLPPGRTREYVGFLPNSMVLLRRLRTDSRVSGRGRVALGAALGYLVSPIQLIPNFIPVVGQADDFLVVVLALRYSCRRLPRADVEAAWPGDPAYLDQLLGRPKPGGAAEVARELRSEVQDGKNPSLMVGDVDVVS